MFHIQITRFHWINDLPDDGTDLCLHGETTVRIGERELAYDATVTSTALYLLKSLTEDHIIGTNNQMLPCCGHMWVPDEQDPDSVTVVGCNCGIDWSVTHEGDTVQDIVQGTVQGTVRLTLEDGYTVTLPLSDYAAEVCRYADTVEAAYHAALPRILPEDAFDRKMFAGFWAEWKRRREGGKVADSQTPK